MSKDNEYFAELRKWLEDNNWREPTTEDFPTYLQAYAKHGTNAKAPYFEDIHYAWKTMVRTNLKESTDGDTQ